MKTIYSAVDRDGDTLRVTDDCDVEGGLSVVVRQDSDMPAAVFLDERQLDSLVDAVATFRGREVPAGETDYELRLRALRDAKPLLQGLFGPAGPDKLIVVAEYLVHGLPAVTA